MGEIADEILDGYLCQVCGVSMDDGDGYAQTCLGCSDEEEEDDDDQR